MFQIYKKKTYGNCVSVWYSTYSHANQNITMNISLMFNLSGAMEQRKSSIYGTYELHI